LRKTGSRAFFLAAQAPVASREIAPTYDERTAGGLLYYRARYYDPGLKRFISEDPIGIDAGLNLAVYVSGNPTNFSDPTGQFLIVAAIPALAAATSMSTTTATALAASAVVGTAIAIQSSNGDRPGGNVIPFPTPRPKEDDSCPVPGDGDDNFCRRQKESLENRKELLMKMASTLGLSPQQIRGFNAEVRAHNLRCPKFRVDRIGPTSVK
jgi:RHS repeat-associated protein